MAASSPDKTDIASRLWSALGVACVMTFTQIAAAAPRTPPVRLVGVATIPADFLPGQPPVGGLSGLDYDPVSRVWFLLSDDKSEHGPARLWQADIDITAHHAPEVRQLRLHPILGHDDRPFPPPGQGTEALDAESVRILPRQAGLVWSSEGDARDGFGPAIRTMSRDGRVQATLPLPPLFARDSRQASGPRPNLSIEGLAFTPDGQQLWASLEAPLYQDGPLASRNAGAHVRISEFRYPAMRLRHQFAYHVDPIGPVPAGRLADNGVSEILAIDARHVLVLERSGRQQASGGFAFHTRLYCADFRHAQDVADLPLLNNRAVAVARKRLVFDFGKVAAPVIDNVEGMAWGPRLPGGERSLVLVTDNDFAADRPNQLITLAVRTPATRYGLAHALCP